MSFDADFAPVDHAPLYALCIHMPKSFAAPLMIDQTAHNAVKFNHRHSDKFLRSHVPDTRHVRGLQIGGEMLAVVS